jgi:hypothetical protein
MTLQKQVSFTVDVDPQFWAFIPAALLRLGSQHSGLAFQSVREGAIRVQGESETGETVIAKSVEHCIYREKIYSETLTMRRALVSAVTRR